VLHDDLHRAVLQALELPRERARERALEFDWRQVCDEFIAHLVPARSGATTVTPLSQKLHKLSS
jgi:hypothetical protein